VIDLVLWAFVMALAPLVVGISWNAALLAQQWIALEVSQALKCVAPLRVEAGSGQRPIGRRIDGSRSLTRRYALH
jgi:hypothetical protein